MPGKIHSSLDKVLGRLDQLDEANLHNLVQRLARRRILLETVFNTLQEGVLVIDAAGLIDYANEAAARLVGLKDHVAGENLWRLVPGCGGSPGDTTTAPVATQEFELSITSPRGPEAWVWLGDGSAAGTARRSFFPTSPWRKNPPPNGSRMRRFPRSCCSRRAWRTSWVIRSLPDGHLQLIDQKLKNSRRRDPLARDSIKVCRDEVTRLDGIIKNFLEAIRPRPPDLAEVYLPELIDDVLSFEGRELADRGIAVEAELPTATPVIMADRDQLKQVFFNLLKNAMEAMQPGGRLTVKMRTAEESVYVAIADTGGGIKAEDLARLFQPYHTTKVSGHGLGLMIVQRILRDHGGHVGIESREGVGTVVTLQFYKTPTGEDAGCG